MLNVIYHVPDLIRPFNEPARDLTIQNKPLFLNQRNLLAPYVTKTEEYEPGKFLKPIREPFIAFKDNLYFDEDFINTFMSKALRSKHAVRAAIHVNDPAFREHALPLSKSYTPAGEVYLADLWYYPKGITNDVRPLLIDLGAKEAGYYSIPDYMGGKNRELTYQCPSRSLIAIDSWVHVFIADIVFGVFARARRADARSKEETSFRLKLLLHALFEGTQVLGSSELVKVGQNCVIDPHAIIHGPTTIGDNVEIAAGAVIENCIIGNNVTVSQGCQLMLSVVGDGTFLPFDSKLFMTTLMENSMVAQNTCLQMCVVGRNTFIGAGTTFTDFNLLSSNIRALDGFDKLSDSNRLVLGGCVGHNCRIGSGLIIYPARTIESDVVLVSTNERRVIDKDVKYEESDHHLMRGFERYVRKYPRSGKAELENWE